MRFAPDLALSEPWNTPERYWPALSAATAELDPPYAVLDQAALDFNAHDMLRRAGGKPIRVASKSIRVRSVIESLLQLEGYAGVLAYTLPEALWLARTIDDVVVGYPSVHRAAIRTLATDPELAARVTIMVDSVDQLDVVDSVLPPGERESIRVCLELDASWDAPVVGHIGVRRSPVHTAGQAAVMARIIDSRPGFELVGMMSYEAQIAGLANDTPGQRGRSAIIRAIQVRSMRELAERRAEAVAAVRQIAQLWFVNGGGTGSLESTGADDSVTEIAAGSGLFGPHLFDNYRHFSPAPAAAFALSVVRTPAAGMATLMGGGWIASGPPGPDRLPKIVWPEGTAMVGTEMAGEVQTPLSGPGAAGLSAGDRVWLRHTKAGELSEHVNQFALVDGGTVTEMLPTYRGEGQDFL